MNSLKKRHSSYDLCMEEKSSKIQKKANKANIIHNIDIKDIVINFIKNYFSSIVLGGKNLFENKMIRYFTKFKFNGEKLYGNDIKKCFDYFKDTKINIIKYDLLECGSRRIDIIIRCCIKKDDKEFTFSQYFLLCNASSWYIMNSIII